MPGFSFVFGPKNLLIPPFPGNAAEYVLKTPTPAVMAHDRAEFCDFWDSLGYTFK